jgi:hypothetical protein
MVEEVQEYRWEWRNSVERIRPERFPWQALLIALLEDQLLDVPEENGHSNSFSQAAP